GGKQWRNGSAPPLTLPSSLPVFFLCSWLPSQRPGRTVLPELDRRQGDGHEDGGDEPEADDDLLLGPAREVEVVVDRGALEDALALAELEVPHLHDDADGLEDEDPADDQQQELLPDDDGD